MDLEESAESNQKTSQTMLKANRTMPLKTKLAIALANTGREVSSETKLKISLARRGRKFGPLSPESAQRKRSFCFGGLSSNAKKVIQLDLNGNFIKEWDCIADIRRTLGFKWANLNSACSGRIKSSMKFKWVFKSDYEKIKSHS